MKYSDGLRDVAGLDGRFRLHIPQGVTDRLVVWNSQQTWRTEVVVPPPAGEEIVVPWRAPGTGGGGTFRILVTDRDTNLPVPSAVVSSLDSDGVPGAWKNTDPSGTVILSGLATGLAWVGIQSEGYLSTEVRETVTEGETTEIEVRLTSETSLGMGSLELRILDEQITQGFALATRLNERGPALWPAEIGPWVQGSEAIKWPELPRGTYSLLWYPEGVLGAGVSAGLSTVEAGRTTRTEFKKGSFGTLRIVFGPGYVGWARVYQGKVLRAAHWGFQMIGLGGEDKDKRVLHIGLPQGIYRLELGTIVGTETREVEVGEDSETRLELP